MWVSPGREYGLCSSVSLWLGQSIAVHHRGTETQRISDSSSPMLNSEEPKDLLRADIAKPGAHKREVYRELLESGMGVDSTLSRAIDRLAECGFLRLNKTPGIIQVWPTAKAKQYLSKQEVQPE